MWLSSAGRGPQQRRARHLYAAARRPKTLHEFPLAAPDAYADRLLAFFGPALAVDGAAGEWPADDTGPAATPTAATEPPARPLGERTVAPATAMMVAFAVVPLAMLGLIAPFQLRWGLSPPRLPVGRPLVAVLGFIGLLLAGLLLRDAATGATWVLSAAAGAPRLLDVPERCAGGLVVRDGDGDGPPELIRDGCATPGRLAVVWDGASFVVAP